MVSFSQRYGYSSIEESQYECMDDVLMCRIWNKFYGKQFESDNALKVSIGASKSLTNIERMMDKMGVVYKYPDNSITKQLNAEALRKHLFESNKWYLMYDFIEKYLELLDMEKRQDVVTEYNKILEEEVSGYRIINGLVAPIVSENELQSITEATQTPHDAVNTHISKALSLFANRKIPDYENSIKESISAVEALCKFIVDDEKDSLGKALKKLESKGIPLHTAFRNALDSLYGYTSDEGGIRHAGIDFKNAPAEDARFMLITCSAFVNYLIEKWEKAQK
jgi:hypothetical protein